MAYRRRRTRRGGRGRRGRRRGMRMRMKRSPYSNSSIFFFKRTVVSTLIISYNGVLTHTAGSYYYTLADLPNYTELTALYDSYRIVGIAAKFIPRYNSFGFSDYTATATEVPPLGTAIDYDDDTAPSDITTLAQYTSFKIHNGLKPFKIYFKPKYSLAAYSGAFTSYASTRNIWLDMSSPTVRHYGIKYCTPEYSGSNSGESPVWDIFTTYYIQCKYQR